MSNVENLLKIANDYHDSCLMLIKDAYIKKMPSGKYRVLSEKGKNLGESATRPDAEKRLREVEYFKHKDNNEADDKELDLTDLDDFGYSAMMRKIRQKGSKQQVRAFLEIYKKNFDKAVRDKLQKPEKVAMQGTAIKFSKLFKVKFPKKMVKNAAIAELGDPTVVGRYLADIIKFTISRISQEKRPSALASLKQKLYALDEKEISNKNLPASASMGQSITFVKTILFNHDAKYIREVLNNLVRFL